MHLTCSFRTKPNKVLTSSRSSSAFAPVGPVVSAARAAAGARAAAVQLAAQIARDGLEVHEVAEAGARALAHLVLA